MPPTGTQNSIVLPLPLYLLCVGARFARSFYGDVIRPWFYPDDVWVSHPRIDARSEYFARTIFEDTNRYRTMLGLPTLLWSDKLVVAALNHSRKMALLAEFAHVLSDGVVMSDRIRRAGFRFTIVAENIAWIQQPGSNIEELAHETQVGWVNSPPHRANLDNPDFTHLGVGVFYDRARGRWYSTQNFAS